MSLLHPGLHVVRRDDHHLQVGLEPPWRLVLPDDPDVRRVLAELAAGVTPTPSTVAGHRAWRDLRAAGMVVSPAPAGPPARIAVTGAGRAVGEAARLLAEAGTVPAGGTGAADLTLVLSPGEPRRETVDDLVRDGRAHLLLTASPTGYRVGPLVVPGETACLRCVDAHLAERDPRRGVVVEQLAGRPADPDDPVLESLAVAWAVRDALRHVAGEPTATWSATLDLGRDLAPARREWRRHPHCGCSWADRVSDAR